MKTSASLLIFILAFMSLSLMRSQDTFSNAAAREVCNDGQDNNGDGQVDYLDPDCSRNGRLFFFSTSGNDEWNGLSSIYLGGSIGPKKSISELNRLMKYESRPGDSFLLKRGDVWSSGTGIKFGRVQGAPNNEVLLSSYGTGRLPKISLTRNDVTNLISVTGESRHLIIENVHLEGRGQARVDRPLGVFVGNFASGAQPNFILFRQLHITDNAEGVVSYGNMVSFRNCYLKDNYKDAGTGMAHRAQGMYIKGTGGVIEANLFDGNGYPFDLSTVGGNTYSWSLYHAGDNYIIRKNIFQNAFTAVKIRAASNIVFERNLIQNIEGMGITVGGDSTEGMTNVMLRKNILRRTGDGIVLKRQSGGGFEARNIYILNNVIHDNILSPVTGESTGAYRAAVSLLSGANHALRDVYLMGNTIANLRKKSGLQAHSDLMLNVQVKSNIFHRADSNHRHNLVYSFGATLHQKNLFYDQAEPIENLDSTELNEDPLFIDAHAANFQLQKSSPAIDSGFSGEGLYSDDFLGIPRRGLFDMGAFEFSGTSVLRANY